MPATPLSSQDTEPRPGLALYNALLPTLSRSRLESFKLKGDNELDALVRYNWNLSLCEALYPSVQCLEIALRNRLNDVLLREFGRNWMWNFHLLSHSNDQTMINKAEAQLIRHSKRVENSRMVTELTLGFWVSLHNRRFERVLWQRPNVIQSVFPFIPARVRNLSYIRPRLESVNDLRNRISHHEPVWNWKSNLLAEHHLLLETLSWLCAPEVTDFVKSCDRFPHVHTGKFQSELRTKLQEQSRQIHMSIHP